MDIVWDGPDGGITLERSARACVAAVMLRPDATVECANRHRVVTALPADRATRVLIDNWIAKKGAQLHVQHERWERGEDEE